MRFSESELILNPDSSVYHLNLLPENIADTIIAVGDPGRVYRVSKLFDKIEFEMVKREFITHTGYYKGRRVTTISTGMGTDNIEIFLNELDALVNIDLKKRKVKEKHTALKIIRVGTSATIREDIALDSHLASVDALGMDTLMAFYQYSQSERGKLISKAIQNKFNLSFLPYFAEGSELLLQTYGEGMLKGSTITFPGFYAPQGRRLRYELKHEKMIDDLNYFHEQDAWFTNFEMETAGYYALGKILGHHILSLNAIIANRANQTFSKNVNKTVDSLIKKVLDRLI